MWGYYINMERPVGWKASRSVTKRISLILCAVMLAWTVIPVASVLPADSILFQPEPYLQALEKAGLYRDYPHLIIDFNAAGGDLLAPGLGEWLTGLVDRASFESTLRFLFPEDWVRGQVQTLVKNFWAYYNFESQRLDLSIDFTPVKQRLTGGDGLSLIQSALQDWPPCSVEDIIHAGALLLKGQAGGLPRCKPPAELQKAYLGTLQFGLNSFATALPDRLYLFPIVNGPVGGPYRLFRDALQLAPLGLLLLLAGMALILETSWRRLLAWVGPAWYTGGLVSLILAGISGWLAAWLFPAPARLLPPPGAALIVFSAAVGLEVWQRFALGWAIAGSIFAAIGCILILISRRIDPDFVSV
jgi:hypothetical protein